MRLVAEVNVEEGLSDEPQCQGQHLCCDIQWLISLAEALPSIEQGDGSASHQGAKGSQALSMEGWLHEVPLMQPGFPIVSDESPAEQGLKDLVGIGVFVVVSLILLEYMLDAIRVVDQVGGPEKE